MNHIQRLQEEVRRLRLQQQATDHMLHAFRSHLSLPKYAAVQQDGERGDWIATADVLRWLSIIEGAKDDAANYV